MLASVREHIKDYEKGSEGVFQSTLTRLPEPMKRADRLMNRTEPREDGP
jgi:hypothetical protein